MNEIDIIVVGTKSDKLSNNKLNTQLAKNKKQLAEIGVTSILPFSSVTKKGKEELLNSIASFL